MGNPQRLANLTRSPGGKCACPAASRLLGCVSNKTVTTMTFAPTSGLTVRFKKPRRKAMSQGGSPRPPPSGACLQNRKTERRPDGEAMSGSPFSETLRHPELLRRGDGPVTVGVCGEDNDLALLAGHVQHRAHAVETFRVRVPERIVDQ